MKLIEKLISFAKDYDYEVKNVTVGLHWTCVLSKYCGIAMTYSQGMSELGVRGAGELENRTVGELAELLRSWNLIEASIGLASINSVISAEGEEGNVLDLAYSVSKGKRVVMIGRFPAFEKLKEVAKEVIVLELNPFLLDPQQNIILSTASEEVLPEADVVIITSSTIINKSIDRILELSKNAYNILIGPSTPMLDDLFDEGIDVLAGVKVINPHGVEKKIRQAVGMITPKKMGEDLKFIIKENRS
ncbi:MAG: DUF364 domain-containing protein [Sulfolobaceae archaeon]|nr:DUF364 domain-containing protein [Sulfolobaceae archaeon]